MLCLYSIGVSAQVDVFIHLLVIGASHSPSWTEADSEMYVMWTFAAAVRSNTLRGLVQAESCWMRVGIETVIFHNLLMNYYSVLQCCYMHCSGGCCILSICVYEHRHSYKL